MATASEAADARVPDAVAPPPGNRRFPLLDGLRAVAVLCVLLVHVAVFSEVGSEVARRLLLHLNIGVTIFFLISGFVLYRPFISHRAAGPPASGLGRYARRRFLRILPAYWLVLTVLTILPGTTGVSGGDWLGQYTLLHTVDAISDRSCVSDLFGCGLAQTWSLVVELTFYALLPLYVVVAGRLARGRSPHGWLRLELGALAVLAVASVVLHFGTSDGGMPGLVDGTLLGYLLWFGLGMGLAVVSVWLEATGARPRVVALVGRHPSVPWGLALAAYLTLCFAIPPTAFLLTDAQQLAVHLVFALVALLLMLPAVFGDGEGGAPRRLLANPVVAWLGLVSYGIFLWHFVVTVELGFRGDGLSFWALLPATLAISISCAALSYYLLERPLLRFK